MVLLKQCLPVLSPPISSCLEQADFPAPQVTFHSGLPDQQRSKQVVNSEKRKLRQAGNFPRTSEFKFNDTTFKRFLNCSKVLIKHAQRLGSLKVYTNVATLSVLFWISCTY